MTHEGTVYSFVWSVFFKISAALSYEEYTNTLLHENGFSQENPFADKNTKGYPYGINVFHINTADFPSAYLKLGPKPWSEHYNIAHWVWELEELPEHWIPYMCMANEFWTPSEFASSVFRKYTKKKVVTVPHSVTAPYDEKYDRKYFGLPEDKFLFLTMYASDSLVERKNPQAVVRAFKKAFKKNDPSVGLVIKVVPSKHRTDDIDELKRMTAGYNNVYFLTGEYEKIEVNSMLRDVDAYVSLHRSEGFGLTLAESMMLGTPTISTNWSGNVEFQNEDTACMREQRLRRIYGLHLQVNLRQEISIRILLLLPKSRDLSRLQHCF